MNLYLDSGYANMQKMIETDVPFVFVVGGRGTGKTYGALKYLLDKEKKFMFMRRRKEQTDMINRPELSPFKSINEDTFYNVHPKPIGKGMAGFFNVSFDSETQEEIPQGDPLGYSCALSTISNIRGFDGSDIEILVYDEFIGEKHERPIRNEGSAFLNAYETINRNRELKGKKPLKAVCLSNSNDLANPLFMELKLVTVVEKMMAKGQNFIINKDRGFAVFYLTHSPISDKKSNTALYKLVDKGSSFYEMSIDNAFSNEEIGLIKSQNLKEYVPIVFVGELCIYKHKSERKYYVTDHKSGTVRKVYDTGDMELKRFRRDCGMLWFSYMNNNIFFESYIHQLLFEKYFGTI